jgi:hypothetical protein
MAGGFGDGFLQAYTAVSGVLDQKERTKLAGNQDRRAQAIHDLDVNDRKEIEEASARVRQTLLDSTKQIADNHSPAPQAAGVVADPSVAPPAPPALPRTAAITPPGDANMPANAPMGDPGAAPPDTSVAPTPAPPPPAANTRANLKQLYDDASKVRDAITPDLVKIVMKSNPTKGAELALAFTDRRTQDRMTKTIAVGSLMKANGGDPAIDPLLTEVMPNYIPGTWRNHPPDSQGKQGYGQLTMRNQDGTTTEVAVYPQFIDNMLASTMSAKGVLDYEQVVKEQERKDKGTAAEIESGEKAAKLGRDRFDLVTREYNEGAAQRAATLDNTRASAASHRADAAYKGEARTAAIDQRREIAEQKRADAVAGAMFKVAGASPQTMADPETAKGVREAFGSAHAIMDANGMDQTPPNGGRAMAVAMDIASGNTGNLYMKEGKYYYNTGDPKNALLVPHVALPPPLRAQLAKAATPKPAPRTAAISPPPERTDGRGPRFPYPVGLGGQTP